VVFTLENQRYAIRLSAVDKAVRMVEVTPLPKAPEIVIGAVNLRGLIIPVLNVRRRFRLPEREAGTGDHLLIARTARRTVALVVDEVHGTVEHSEQDVTETGNIVPGLEYVAGVIKFTDGMLFIHDLDEFLSLDEEEALTAALSGEIVQGA